ncbi:anaphase-promoting complex subunit 5-domain-containing protein [Gamsiella multidivaricata]|uniref:anaphase-promoting complex subunit 5-domain-containing protein n=1 Tax=Gamsiella multidivaricata TaxID=101098 RepID=UPI00221FEDE2|nr:anaphase-promoting complex subunit 5-domain-containing protein [Gamsiella multidivaricata]KAI7831578.1 anaphase-promoting complex subunit 5-domain-containing protein [Gamsiella multidivaricata]
MAENREITLDPASIMGLYVRKAQIEYKKLEFEEMCKFYTALETYITALDKSNHTSQLKDQPPASSEESTVLSAFDMEKYLDLQTQQLSNPGEVNIPEDLMAHVFNIQSRMPALAKTHYITCLHAQQTGNFEVAIQSLHRFFDYSMVMHDRVLYQYALLNLAMLHARFSHYEQALIALRETIEVARDHMDQECLSYALNWLYRLSGTTSGSNLEANEAQILANLDGKTDGRAFHYLQSLSELAVAKQMQGESMPRALEALLKASSIDQRHSLEGISGVVQLYQSRIWGAYGSSSLSSLYSQLQLQYHLSEADMNDAALGYSKAASDLALEGRFDEALRVIELAKTKFPLETMKATPWVQTLVQILHRRAMSNNQVRDAELWTHQLGTTLLNTSILSSSTESNVSNISKIDSTSKLSSYENQPDDAGRDIQLEIRLQRALVSVLAGKSLSGVQQLSEGLAVVQKSQWPGTRKFSVMYLLALAEIYMESDSAISAIQLLLTALSLSEHNLQRPLLLLVRLRLSEALLYLDSVKHASDLVNDIMTMALNQGDIFIRSVAYFQRAKCLRAQANKMVSPLAADSIDTDSSQNFVSSHQRLLERILEHLDRAFEGFESIESLKDMAQVLYFKVRVYRQLSQTDEIEKTLRLFKTISLKLSSARNKHEPNWYSYYYALDAFDGILGVNDDGGSVASDATAQSKKDGGGSLQKQSQLTKTGSPEGFKRAGSSHWGGLKRTPSQLWQSAITPQQVAALSPQAEQVEVGKPESDEDKEDPEEDDMEVDTNLGSGNGSSSNITMSGFQEDDSAGPSPSKKKKRRVAE